VIPEILGDEIEEAPRALTDFFVVLQKRLDPEDLHN